MDKVIDFINVNRDRYLEELKALLAIPSISALPEHAGDVTRCAEWCADEMRRIGLQNVRLISTPGNPVVYGDWLGALGAPTILFYGHYDVQPVDPLNLWQSPPFDATIRDGEIYARGSADDKGQVFMHFNAVQAHMRQNGRLPVYMKVMVAGEGEVRGGRIKIPGFYDDVVPLKEEERQAWATLPFNEKQYKNDFGIPKLFGEPGYTTLERTWARPTFEVNGLLSGFTAEGAKTVLPAVSMAKVSMRLVPNQDPDKTAALFEAHVRDVAPKTVEVKVTRMHGGKPWMTSYDNPFVQAAGRAIEKGFGRPPVFTREGGSIPVVSTFQEELGVPSVLFGVGLPDENAHAPNEKLDVSNFHNGIIASAYLYDEMAHIAVPA